MKLFYKIYTLGCKVNQYDAGSLAAEFEQSGFIKAEKNAGIVIINSCAVTKTAMIKSGRMVKLAKKQNPKAKIILAGCWPRLNGVKVAGVDFIIKDKNTIKAVKKILKKYLKADDEKIKLSAADRSRYFIKIQDGCEQYCTYCIIPYVRGKLKSRGEKEIICEIRKAVEAGYEEIVLSGIHLGLYGKDNKNNLVSLIKKIIKIKDLGRVRLSSIEITEVSSEMINLMAEEKKICRHLHLPLQAGSDKVLKLMNRPYSIKNYKLKITSIRKMIPDIAITTDVITGFPGETEKDFKETIKFIKEIKFSRLHVFPFSAHAKLPAARLPNQIEEKEKIKRARILRRIGIKLADNYKKKFKNKILDVVIERIKADKIIGKTEYYFDVEFKRNQIINDKFSKKQAAIGKIVKIK